MKACMQEASIPITLRLSPETAELLKRAVQSVQANPNTDAPVTQNGFCVRAIETYARRFVTPAPTKKARRK
jgi:uncharacterized protein (DUF1778 family)